jgi:hypothetical protein
VDILRANENRLTKTTHFFYSEPHQSIQIPNFFMMTVISLQFVKYGQMCRRCFTPDEDNRLRNLVNQFGSNAWSDISAGMSGRTVRQCRDRWFHYLSRSINQIPWTIDEDAMLIEKIGEFGLKWTQLMTFFPNRTDLDLKQRWLWICRNRRDLLIKDAFRPIRSTQRTLKLI